MMSNKDIIGQAVAKLSKAGEKPPIDYTKDKHIKEAIQIIIYDEQRADMFCDILCTYLAMTPPTNLYDAKGILSIITVPTDTIVEALVYFINAYE